MIVVTKDLYTLRSWEGQDTESLTLHLTKRSGITVGMDCLILIQKENARCFISQAREKLKYQFLRVVHGEAIGNIRFCARRNGCGTFQCGSRLLDQ